MSEFNVWCYRGQLSDPKWKDQDSGTSTLVGCGKSANGLRRQLHQTVYYPGRSVTSPASGQDETQGTGWNVLSTWLWNCATIRVDGNESTSLMEGKGGRKGSSSTSILQTCWNNLVSLTGSWTKVWTVLPLRIDFYAKYVLFPQELGENHLRSRYDKWWTLIFTTRLWCSRCGSCLTSFGVLDVFV